MTEIHSAPRIKMTSEGAIEVFSWHLCEQEHSCMDGSNVARELMSLEKFENY